MAKGKAAKPSKKPGTAKPNTERKARRDYSPLRVVVNETERALIHAGAQAAGLSVSAYLRNVGAGYPVRSIVDLAQVGELVKVNADLGRIGGLLKLWLASDRRLDPKRFPHLERTIHAALKEIDASQTRMRAIMDRILTS